VLDRVDRELNVELRPIQMVHFGLSTRRIFETDACSNQGNSVKATKSSRSPRKTKKPCLEMFETSASKVAVPGFSDFIFSASE